MKILTNWSVPTNKTMKYVRKTAMATMMLATSAVGMTSCDSFTKNKGTNETYTTYDTTNETMPDTLLKAKYGTSSTTHKTIPNISYETHKDMLSRLYPLGLVPSNIKESFKERGLYGGTLYVQMIDDYSLFRRAADGLVNLNVGYEADEEPDADLDEESWSKALDLTKSYINLQLPQKSLNIMDRKLFSNGEPTWQECSDYLDEQIADLDFLSQRDYKKCLSDFKKFEEAQKKHDEFAKADLLAYKQFKLDSLKITNALKELGLLDSYECKQYLEDMFNDCSERVLCPVPNWNPDMVD